MSHRLNIFPGIAHPAHFESSSKYDASMLSRSIPTSSYRLRREGLKILPKGNLMTRLCSLVKKRFDLFERNMVKSMFIPIALKKYADEKASVQVNALDMEETRVQLGALYPEIGNFVFDGKGKQERFINVIVEENNIKNRDGIKTLFNDGAGITLISAITGGTHA